MEKFIQEKFKCDVTTLAEAGIEVKMSAQVRLGDLQDVEYCEITPSNVRPYGDYNYDRNIQTKANLVSLGNQSLHAGDVLIPAKKRLSHIAVFKDKKYPKKSKFYNLPTVATIGMAIIRTKNNDMAEFIEFYLSLPELQEYINSNPLIRNGTGRISMTREFIKNIPFPSIIKTQDFSMFTQQKHKLHMIQQNLERSADILDAKKDDILALSYSDKTTDNVNQWEEFDIEFKLLQQKYPNLFKTTNP